MMDASRSATSPSYAVSTLPPARPVTWTRTGSVEPAKVAWPYSTLSSTALATGSKPSSGSTLKLKPVVAALAG
jgi:hypothetical protein